MTTVPVEELLAEEIRTTRVRLEALEFAYDLLTGTRDVPAASSNGNGSQPGPPPSPADAAPRKRRRHTDEEKRIICDRAHELRSVSKAAAEFEVTAASIYSWMSAGHCSYEGLPGNRLPPEVADDLRR